jgi:hypothetical protein
MPPAKPTVGLLVLASPLLILLALVSMALRSPSARPQALPALLIGVALLGFSWLRRRQRRSMLLRALRQGLPGVGR